MSQVDTAGQNGLHKAAFLDADGGDHDEVFKVLQTVDFFQKKIKIKKVCVKTMYLYLSIFFQVLIKAGADMKLKDKTGDVPVTLAGKEDAVK